MGPCWEGRGAGHRPTRADLGLRSATCGAGRGHVGTMAQEANTGADAHAARDVVAGPAEPAARAPHALRAGGNAVVEKRV